MEFTGELYFFYSNKEYEKTLVDVKKYADSIEYKYDEFNDEDEINIMFYKDKEMLHHHEEEGYNIETNGQGCFHLAAKKVDLNGVAELFEFNQKPIAIRSDINLYLQEINYFVLTIPFSIKEDIFSKQIYDAMRIILDNNHEFNLIPRW